MAVVRLLRQCTEDSREPDIQQESWPDFKDIRRCQADDRRVVLGFECGSALGVHPATKLLSRVRAGMAPHGQKNGYTKPIHHHFNASQFGQNTPNLNNFTCNLMPCHGSFHLYTVLQDLGDLINPTVDRVLFEGIPALLCKLFYNAVLLTRPFSYILFG